MVPTLVAISIVTFTIIQLPPGDYLSTMITELQSQGEGVQQAEDRLPAQDLRPRSSRSGSSTCAGSASLLHGDLGYSFEYDRPVTQVIGDRLALTIVI